MLQHLDSLSCVYTTLWWDCQESCTCDDLGLSKDDLLGDAALPLVQLLTNAGDDTKTALQSVGRLLTNELTRHTHTQISNHTVYTLGHFCVSYSCKKKKEKKVVALNI